MKFALLVSLGLLVLGCGRGDPLSSTSLQGRWETQWGASVYFHPDGTMSADGGAFGISYRLHGPYWMRDGYIAARLTGVLSPLETQGTGAWYFRADVSETTLTLTRIDEKYLELFLDASATDGSSEEAVRTGLDRLSGEAIPSDMLDDPYRYVKE